jgi:hypothetical protein
MTLSERRTGAQPRGRIPSRWDKTGKTMGQGEKPELDTYESPQRGRVYRHSLFPDEKSVQLLAELSCIHSGGSWQCDEHHIRLGRYFVPIQPEVLSEPPLDPISSASLPSSPTRRNPQSRNTQRISQHSDAKMGGAVTRTHFHDSPVFGGTSNPVLFGQPEMPLLRPTGACVLLPFSVGGRFFHF